MAADDFAREHVDIDVDVWPGARRQLRFLVIGDDIGAGAGTTDISCVPACTYWPTRRVRLRPTPSTVR